MLIDMHNHTNISSPCSLLSPEELIVRAKNEGLDAICVTDHLFIEGANISQRIGYDMNFPVFRGIEARTTLGDMLVYGYYKDVPEGISLEDLCWYVHEVGGVIFVAHPYHVTGGCNLFESMQKKGLNLDLNWNDLNVLKELDGVEIINGQVCDEKNEMAKNLAKKLIKPGIGGSDAHSKNMIARAATKFKNHIHSEVELVIALKQFDYEAIRLKK